MMAYKIINPIMIYVYGDVGTETLVIRSAL